MESIEIEDIEPTILKYAKMRLESQARPKGSLGCLDKLATQVAGIYNNVTPPVPKVQAVVMCGDHGIAEEKISAFPQEVTRNIANAFIEGGTAYNVFCDHVGATMKIVDCGIKGKLKKSDFVVKAKIANGTSNILFAHAMKKNQAVRSIELGIEVARDAHDTGHDVIAIGEIGNSNTAVASALLSALTGEPAGKTVGAGTGISRAQLERKISIVNSVLRSHAPNPNDPIDCLMKVGGFEIGAMTGAILGAASRRMCVVVDGFISTVSALLAIKINPKCSLYIVYSHKSKEQAHGMLLTLLKARAILNFNLRLGECTGAILASSYVVLACKLLSDMCSFEELKTPNPYL